MSIDYDPQLRFLLGWRPALDFEERALANELVEPMMESPEAFAAKLAYLMLHGAPPEFAMKEKV